MGEWKTAGLHGKRGGEHYVERVCHASTRCEPVRAVLERMEPGHDEEQSLPARESCRRSWTQRVWLDRGAATSWTFTGCGGEARTQVGVRTAVDIFGIRTANRRRRPCLHRFRF